MTQNWKPKESPLPDNPVTSALIDQRDELLNLLLHVNVLPHHARPFKAGNVDYAGCPSCAKIRDVWFQHGRLHSDRDPEQQAAFVPPEDAENSEDSDG